MHHDKKQILIWSLVTLGIVGLFIGLAYLGGNNGTPTTNTLAVAINDSDHKKGSTAPKATIVEYSDFQCPACGQYEPLVQEVANSFPQDLQVVYRHFPLTELHPNALPAAIASEAAQAQGKFWEYHDLLFAKQLEWSDATSTDFIFTSYATTLGLNTAQFQKDLKAENTKNKVSEDIATGNSSGINATPTFYLNGTQIQPQSLDEFKTLVQDAINKNNT